MGPKNAFFQNVYFWGPNWVGGASYGIFLIRAPALRAGLKNKTMQNAKQMFKSKKIPGKKVPLFRLYL